MDLPKYFIFTTLMFVLDKVYHEIIGDSICYPKVRETFLHTKKAALSSCPAALQGFEP